MAQRRYKVWAARPPRPVAPEPGEKAAIIEACEFFVANVLKPRFLPAIVPTEFNYMVDIRGDWRAGRYRFVRRYRSGMEHNAGDEFDAPFARLDHMGPNRFDIHWMRHTGQWWPLHAGLTLTAALETLETNPVLHPY